MTQKNSSQIISVVHPIYCGLDVHKDMVSACIIITEPKGEQQIVGEDHVNETTKTQGWHYGFILIYFLK